jgi:hypothetical protein
LKVLQLPNPELKMDKNKKKSQSKLSDEKKPAKKPNVTGTTESQKYIRPSESYHSYEDRQHDDVRSRGPKTHKKCNKNHDEGPGSRHFTSYNRQSDSRDQKFTGYGKTNDPDDGRREKKRFNLSENESNRRDARDTNVSLFKTNMFKFSLFISMFAMMYLFFCLA